MKYRNIMFNSFPRMCLYVCHICQLSHLTSVSLPACFSNMQRPLSTITHLVGENGSAVWQVLFRKGHIYQYVIDSCPWNSEFPSECLTTSKCHLLHSFWMIKNLTHSIMNLSFSFHDTSSYSNWNANNNRDFAIVLWLFCVSLA